MGIHHGTFHIKLDDKNYISAIITYFPDASITSFSEDHKPQKQLNPKVPLFCKQLPFIINDLQKNQVSQVKMGYAIEESHTLHHLFPEIRDVKPTHSSTKKLDHAKAYIDSQILLITSDWEVVETSAEPFIDKLNREETLYLLKDLNYQKVLELPQLSGCLLQTESKCLYISWNKKLSIRPIENIHFDLNDGFSNHDLNGSDKLQQDIHKKLQEQFIAWKNNGYKGSLFPQQMNPLKEVDEADETSWNCCSCFNFFFSTTAKYQLIPNNDFFEENESCAIM